MVQPLHPYMTPGKTIAWTIRTFVGKGISLLFNTLSRFVIAILPRSKCILILWLQWPSTLILEPKKIKPTTVSTFSPSICQEVMGPNTMIFVFWMLSFKPAFSYSPFSSSSRGSLASLHFFCCKGVIIWISEIVDISPSNLYSSLWFRQPGISHDVLCI